MGTGRQIESARLNGAKSQGSVTLEARPLALLATEQ